jgi:hypothetical protein
MAAGTPQSPVARLVAEMDAEFTFDDVVRAAERDPAGPVSEVVRWFRRPAGVRDTGRRRYSATALRGAKLYHLS